METDLTPGAHRTLDLTGLPEQTIREVTRIVEEARRKQAEEDARPGANADAAAAGREMLAYRDEVKRSLGGRFRELAHSGHRY